MATSNAATNKTVKAGQHYKRRVRNIFIHKPMQREFTFVMIALLMVSTLAIGFIIHHTIHSAIYGGFRFGKVSPYELLSDVSYQLIIRVSSVMFVTVLIIGIFGMFFLHRVAGPVYRFRQVFMKVNRGEMPHPIKLREGDFFEEAANEINDVLKRLEFEREKTARVKTKIDQVLTGETSGESASNMKELQGILNVEFDEE